MVSVKINGKEFELTDNPSHGIVKKVKKMRMEGVIKLISTHKELVPANVSVDQAIGIIGANDPEAYTDYTITDNDYNIIATISLACERIFTHEELDAVGDKDLYDIYVECARTLGGDANTFFGRFNQPISFEKSTERKKKQ